MKEQTPGELLAAKVATRVREFRLARDMSVEELAVRAGLTVNEVKIVEEGNEEVPFPTVQNIAYAFDVHPAVLFMTPDEHPLAQILEEHRDLPEEELQRVFRDLIARGWRDDKNSN